MADAPEQIGRYRVERVLGRGAMGVVYQAYDPEIDRPVAIKLVRSDLLDGEEHEDYLVRFRREAQAAGRCAHPNIVAIYDFAMYEGHPFLVMEYVEGESLVQELRRGAQFAHNEACHIVLQVLEALGCAHGLGIVHRDVKPANILLIDKGRVKVTDFGVARIGNAMLTRGGFVVGTPSYMAPEQCRGEEVDQRSDLFSAGVVLFELLTGEKPFPGTNFPTVVKQLLYDEAPDLTGRVPDPVAAVVRRALAKQPEDRFPSAAGMAAALRLAATTAAEATIVTPYRPPPARIPSLERMAPTAVPATEFGAIDEAVLTTLRRRLARHVGPIAKVLVDSAVRNVQSIEGLCELLAERIDSPDERRDFLREARRECRVHATATQIRRLSADDGGATSSGGAGAPTVIAPATVELASAELTRIIGPIARVLVKRALPSCASAAELWAALAEHIEQPAERAAFLRRQPPR